MVAANLLLVPFLPESGLFLLGESMCINRDAAGTPNNAGGTLCRALMVALASTSLVTLCGLINGRKVGVNTDVDILSITISYCESFF